VKKIFLKILLLLILANVGFGDVAQIIGDYYSIDRGKVYYKNKILEGANPKTAELIGFFLLKDDKNVYYMGEKIKDVKIENPETFEFLSDTINTDSLDVFDNLSFFIFTRDQDPLL